MDIDGLKAKIKSGSVAGAYLFYGDEAYMKVWGDSKTKTMAFGVLTYKVNSESLYGWFRLISIVAMAAAAVSL